MEWIKNLVKRAIYKKEMKDEEFVRLAKKVANAKGQLDELDKLEKSLRSSEEIVSDLEQELEKLNNELENSNGVTNEQ